MGSSPMRITEITASLAQLVEHDTLNVGVQGSSPWGSTKAQATYNTENTASLAQLVEHDTLNVGVQGSSPWGSTKKEFNFELLFSCYNSPNSLLRLSMQEPIAPAFLPSFENLIVVSLLIMFNECF